MTDQRLRELLEERVADVTTIDLAAEAWGRASAVRRKRRTLAGVAVAVVAVVGGTTAVVSGRGGDAAPPPATNSTETPALGPKAEHGGEYGGAPVWWAPAAEEEADLQVLTGTALPAEIDLADGAPPVPAGIRAVGLFDRFGGHVRFDDPDPSLVSVLGADGSTYSLDVSNVEPIDVGSGFYIPVPVVSSESLSPDGRFAFFVGRESLDVYDFEESTWISIPILRWAAEATRWSESGSAIWVPKPGSDGRLFDAYSPTGADLGTVDALEGFRESRAIEKTSPRIARSTYITGPLLDPEGTERREVEAIVIGNDLPPDAMLALSAKRHADRRIRCCTVVGWLDDETVLFDSRREGNRILAWRVDTPDLWRVSDIRGWTPGEESYVASFSELFG